MWPIAWFGLIPLWQQLRHGSLRRAAGLGGLWGLGFDGVTLQWITGIHPMDWMGVPWLNSLLIALFCWLAITLWGAALVMVWAIGVRWSDRWGRASLTHHSLTHHGQDLCTKSQNLEGLISKTRLKPSSFVQTFEVGVSPDGLAPHSHRLLNLWTLWAGVALWMGLETLWSHSALWWPWLSLTQSPHNLAILQLNQLSGASVVSGTIVLINGLLALALSALTHRSRRSPTSDRDQNRNQNHDAADHASRQTQTRSRFVGLSYATSAIVLCLSLHLSGWLILQQPLTETRPPLTVGIIQGNIPNDIKLYPGGIYRALLRYRDGYQSLAQQGVDVVLTPETAMPVFWDSDLTRDPNHPAGQLRQAIREQGVPVWLGTFGTVTTNGTLNLNAYTNSLLMLDGNAVTLSRYDKAKLVPIGEYIPFSRLLGGLIRRLSPLSAEIVFGQPTQALVTPWGQAAVAICYESAFPELIRRQVANEAGWILSAANNAHYAASMPRQHHAQDVMRSIEVNRWVARATNTGLSAVIDPHGRTQWRSGWNTFETHISQIFPRQTQTLYTRWGNWLTWLFLSGWAIGMLSMARTRLT